jgi:hypothetical protein
MGHRDTDLTFLPDLASDRTAQVQVADLNEGNVRNV